MYIYNYHYYYLLTGCFCCKFLHAYLKWVAFMGSYFFSCLYKIFIFGLYGKLSSLN